ncbi:MAG TPA: hypothetical protein VK969_03810 [Acidimicrobiia bacterium]|nr:hypothetical protein [Acidimicrobiia bacterium]
MSRHGTGSLTADVGMMSPVPDPRDVSAIGEDRGHDGEVVEVGPAVVRVVDGVLHPRDGVETF